LPILPIGLRASSAVYDGKNFIYILGGFGWVNERGRNEHFSDIYRFSISSETIEKVGSLPQGLTGSAIWDGSSVIFFGGNDEGGAFKKILKYSPGMKVAIEIGEMPYSSGGSAIVSHKPGEALLFGGDPNVHKIMHYDKCGTVKELKDRRLIKGTTSGSGVHYLTDEEESVFLFGGWCHKDIIHYDVSTGESYVLNETLPVPAFDPFSALIGKYIYIFGGTGNACEGGVSTGVVRFNPQSHELKNIHVDGFPNKIRHASGVFVKSLKRVYMFGGWYDHYYSNNVIKLQF
jgi:hypothetical protein